MPRLPIALLGLTAGANALQWQPELPSWPLGVGAGVALALLACGAELLHRRRRVVSAPFAGACAALMVLAAATCIGFGYAAWRAELRLADALPAGWEGVDITLV